MITCECQSGIVSEIQHGKIEQLKFIIVIHYFVPPARENPWNFPRCVTSKLKVTHPVVSCFVILDTHYRQTTVRRHVMHSRTLRCETNDRLKHSNNFLIECLPLFDMRILSAASNWCGGRDEEHNPPGIHAADTEHIHTAANIFRRSTIVADNVLSIIYCNRCPRCEHMNSGVPYPPCQNIP